MKLLFLSTLVLLTGLAGCSAASHKLGSPVTASCCGGGGCCGAGCCSGKACCGGDCKPGCCGKGGCDAAAGAACPIADRAKESAKGSAGSHAH